MLSLEQLQGQNILIDTMKLEKIDHQLTLSMDIQCRGEECTIVFHNVSALCIDHFSYPLSISGFEIIDNLCKGWQAEVRYQVHDFEDGSFCFSCASIDLHP